MSRGAPDWIGIDPEIPVTGIARSAGGADGCDFSIAGAF